MALPGKKDLSKQAILSDRLTRRAEIAPELRGLRS